jgi:hypothetical protein
MPSLCAGRRLPGRVLHLMPTRLPSARSDYSPISKVVNVPIKAMKPQSHAKMASTLHTTKKANKSASIVRSYATRAHSSKRILFVIPVCSASKSRMVSVLTDALMLNTTHPAIRSACPVTLGAKDATLTRPSSMCSACSVAMDTRSPTVSAEVRVQIDVEPCTADGMYFDPSNSKCLACSSQCNRCNYDGVVRGPICLQCAESTILTQGACQPIPTDKKCATGSALTYHQILEAFFCSDC